MDNLNGYTIEGHYYGNIIFKKDGKFKSLDATLKKADLVLGLGIEAHTIDKYLKDSILDEAARKGPKECRDKNGKQCFCHEAVTLVDEKI